MFLPTRSVSRISHRISENFRSRLWKGRAPEIGFQARNATGEFLLSGHCVHLSLTRRDHPGPQEYPAMTGGLPGGQGLQRNFRHPALRPDVPGSRDRIVVTDPDSRDRSHVHRPRGEGKQSLRRALLHKARHGAEQSLRCIGGLFCRHQRGKIRFAPRVD